MSDLFSLYEDNLNQVMNQLRLITTTFSTLSREKAESAITGGVSAIKQGEGILRQMDLEISSNNSHSGMNTLTMKVKNFKNEFLSLKYNFEKMSSNYISKKAENAIIFGTDDNSNKGNQKIELIEHEDNIGNHNINNNSSRNQNKNNSSVGGKVEVKNIFEQKNDGQFNFGDTLPDENDLNVKIEQKNKKIILIATVAIIIILIILIILLSVFLSGKNKDDEEQDLS